MNACKFEACRVEVKARKSFAEVVAAFSRRVPFQDPAALTGLVTAQASLQQIEDGISKMLGYLGFVALANLDAGPLISLLRKPKKIVALYGQSVPVIPPG